MTLELDAMRCMESEDRITLKQSRPLFEGRPSLRTLKRYVLVGLFCPYRGDRIRLEAYRGIGMSWITSRQAIQRFRERLNGAE